MKGSPFKMRTPLYSHQEGHEDPGTISKNQITFDPDLGKRERKEAEPKQKTNTVLNGTDADRNVYKTNKETPASTLADQVAAAKAGESKGSGNTMFDRDGRSVDKFDQRIADAKSKGKLGRVQRLKNRKGGYMESQANKLERAGGTLTDPQKRALTKAGEEAKGTNFGRGFRAFLNRDSKTRKVDPVSTPAIDKTSSRTKRSDFDLGKGSNSAEYDKYVNSRTDKQKADGYDTAEMFYNKKKTKKANKNSSSNGMSGLGPV